MMNLLPPEMWNELTSYMNVDGLLKCRLLNREWKFAIDNSASFVKRIVKVERITAKGSINDPTQMLAFIVKCRTLKVLTLISTGLNQKFYDQLSDCQTTIDTLRIVENFELDLKLVLKMKRLKLLSVNQPMQFDFVSQTLNQLSRLDTLEFRMADTFLTVRPKALLLIKCRTSQLDLFTRRPESTPLLFSFRDDLMDYLQKWIAVFNGENGSGY